MKKINFEFHNIFIDYFIELFNLLFIVFLINFFFIHKISKNCKIDNDANNSCFIVEILRYNEII